MFARFGSWLASPLRSVPAPHRLRVAAGHATRTAEAVRAWVREDVLRRVLRNTGLLGIGKAAGGLLNLLSLALAARMLGPAAFGLLILIRSYSQAATGIARFRSSDALIRFGAARAERGEHDGLRNLAAFTVTLDAAVGTIAAIAAVIALPMLGPWFGLGPEAIGLAQIYCVGMPLAASATPTGLLRIFDRFDALARQSLVTPAVRLVGVGIAALLGAPLWAFVIAWFAADLVSDLYLWHQGWHELRRRRLLAGPLPSPRRAIRENPGLIRFLLATNGASTLNQAVTPIFVLYVGALLGPAAAGIYRLAQMVLKAAGTPGDLAMRSLFPELARLLTRDHGHFWRLIGRALALSTALGLLFAVVVAVLGPFFVTLTMGKDYAAAQPILQIIALCFVPNLAAFPLESALLALGHAGRVLVVRAIAAGAIFGTAGLLVAPLGLRGVGVAVALGAVIATAGLLLMLAAARRLHDNQHRAEPTASIMPSA